MKVTLGIDGLSLLLVLLTAFLIPICILLSWNFSIEINSKKYNIAFLVLEAILFGVFTSLDIMLFYLFFEAVLIPMYFIIGVYGSRKRRIRASYLLFLYTLFSSIFMFLAILYIYFAAGTTDYLALKTMQLNDFPERCC
jgi:NADH-quinone oxidoreductase subunit M